MSYIPAIGRNLNSAILMKLIVPQAMESYQTQNLLDGPCQPDLKREDCITIWQAR